jgi:phosphoribosylanthranilate isomerase
MFQIKICGITSVEDGRMAAAAGADAIGLNFHPGSPRHVAPGTARRIAEALPRSVTKVGVFVNAVAGEICRIFDDVELDLVQLHGDEPPELLAELGGRPVIRAFRLDEAGLEPVRQYLERCERLECAPRLVLFDAFRRGQFGGTGQATDWDAATRHGTLPGRPPMVLAGGLTADNVSQAIETVRPAAVDTASGVESSPGRKSKELLFRFVAAARQAFEE